MVELSTRKREQRRSEEMGEIIMTNWDLKDFVCESIDNPRYGRYES